MALATYADLKQTIQDWLDDSSLSSFTDDFIDIAEARHKREIRVRAMIARATASTGTTDRFLALPSGYISMRRMQLNTNPITLLKWVTPDQLIEAHYRSGAGRPKFYTVHEEIEFDRTPDSNYTAEMIYWKEFDALDSSNTENWLLTNHPDIYLYSSLVAAEPFLREDERIHMWDQLYQSSVHSLIRSDKRGMVSGGAVRSRPAGPTP